LGVENASNLFTKVTAKNIMRHMLYLIVICLASHLLPHLLKKIQIQQEKLLFSGDQPNCGVYGPIDIRYSWQQLNSVCSSLVENSTSWPIKSMSMKLPGGIPNYTLVFQIPPDKVFGWYVLGGPYTSSHLGVWKPRVQPSQPPPQMFLFLLKFQAA